MNSGNNPSLQLNAGYDGTLAGAFTFAMGKVIQGLANRLPGQVIAYDRINNPNFVQVQIMVPMVGTDGSVIPRSQLASIPVQIDGGGGVVTSYPLKTGDLGWIEANDRDISLFLQTFKQTAPNTFRMWDFADSKFTPCYLKSFTVAIEDENAMVISTIDGTIKIAVSETGVVITSPTVAIVGALSLTGGITAPGGGSGGMIFQGNLQVTGSITAGGTITPDTPPP